jgi:hypothetical protein
MTQHNEQSPLIFTRRGAWMGFFAYLILAAIVATVFIAGY